MESILRLKEILKSKGITGIELADAVDVTPGAISNIVSGRSFPKPELLVSIADYLNMDIRELFISTKKEKVRSIYIEEKGRNIKIGELKLDRWDEGSVAGSDE